MIKCPKCSTEFSADTPAGLCPACLLRQRLDSQAGETVAAQVSSAAKSPDEVAAAISSEQLMALLPQFDQIELIGRGGMGVVYRARQTG